MGENTLSRVVSWVRGRGDETHSSRGSIQVKISGDGEEAIDDRTVFRMESSSRSIHAYRQLLPRFRHPEAVPLPLPSWLAGWLAGWSMKTLVTQSKKSRCYRSTFHAVISRLSRGGGGQVGPTSPLLSPQVVPGCLALLRALGLSAKPLKSYVPCTVRIWQVGTAQGTEHTEHLVRWSLSEQLSPAVEGVRIAVSLMRRTWMGLLTMICVFGRLSMPFGGKRNNALIVFEPDQRRCWRGPG
ncbi:hypothetical protein B0H67DRAFT_356465 [Lasiosphaeris hirsuta]|uniref:Uncharacterized protein n=1 Tax=Lasiosphaeris hirsuta TaxID=260670 RepID=A0AA40DIS1_9PEZI|nr:hypothetical protein B0H67DRAFT_356465 [Lasiosphaeris hirsuta]